MNLQRNIEQVIKNIENELLWDKEYISEVMNYNINDATFHTNSSEIPFDSICSLTDFLGVSIEDLSHNNIDYSAIQKKFITPSVAIPEEHTIAAGSFTSSVKSMYNFIKMKFNQATADEVLKRFQIDKAVLRNENMYVNLKLINGILDYCVEVLNFNHDDLLNMSIRGYVDCPRKSILSLVKDTKSDKEIIQSIANISNKFEKNFKYKMDVIQDGKYILRSESNPEFNELLGTNMLSSDLTNTYKEFAMRVIPALMGRSMLSLDATQNYCINGVQYTNYHFQENNLYSFS